MMFNLPPGLDEEDQRLLLALAVIAAFALFFLWIGPGLVPLGYEDELAAREFARQDSVRAADRHWRLYYLGSQLTRRPC